MNTPPGPPAAKAADVQEHYSEDPDLDPYPTWKLEHVMTLPRAD